MRSRADRRIVSGAVGAILCVLAAWSLISAAGSSAGPATRSAGKECHAVKLISARGSGDTLNTIGEIGSKISGALAKRARSAGIDYGAYGLPYTAVGIDWVKLTAPALAAALMAQYQRSKNEGRDTLRAFIKQQARDCPTQKLVLLGYSQGAHVVGDVLSKGVGGLSATEASRIKAAALIADPRFNSKEPFATGKNLRSGHNGLLGARSPRDLDIVKGKISSWCRRSDIVCQGLPGTPGDHSQENYYGDYGEEIVDFLAGKLGWRERPSPAPVVITADRVGGLAFRSAVPADVRRAFGVPTRTWRAATTGFQRNPVPFFAEAGTVVYGYRCKAGGDGDWCTFFAFEDARLVGFYSRSSDFATMGGTRVDTPLGKALKNDAGKWSGTQVQITAITYRYRYGGSAHAIFRAYVDFRSLRVQGFFVSRSPAVGDGG